MHRNYLASTQNVIRIVRLVPIDVQLVVVPVDVRHITVGVARTHFCMPGSVRTHRHPKYRRICVSNRVSLGFVYEALPYSKSSLKPGK